MPKRIQRKRTKGWKMPAGAVYVGRPTRWGNPFPLLTSSVYRNRQSVIDAYRAWLEGRTSVPGGPEALAEARVTLRGHDLACWCRVDQPCHADVLLEIANR